jgi:regulator of cell morphogenesis and NO signaling
MTEAAPIHDANDLTRFIEARYHTRHRKQLTELTALAERVESVHFGDEDVPDGLADLLSRMMGEMDVHMKKEELILFPAIRQDERLGLETPISAMRADHNEHDRKIAEIRRLTVGLVPPKGACQTWTALYAGLADFLTDLEEHIRLENEVLFPQFEPKG